MALADRCRRALDRRKLRDPRLQLGCAEKRQGRGSISGAPGRLSSCPACPSSRDRTHSGASALDRYRVGPWAKTKHWIVGALDSVAHARRVEAKDVSPTLP